MAEFIDINNLWKYIKKRRFSVWIDKVSFLHILLIWILVIVGFGFIYHFFQSNTSFLFDIKQQRVVSEVKDAIYFSVVAATTTGFGDIIPFGKFKIVVIFEIVWDLLLIAIVTSKLISIKQDTILNELYESSFNEKINRLRSSLLLFRQNIERIIIKIEEGSIRKRELNNAYFYVSSLEDALNETFALFTRDKSHFIKDVDPVNTELIFGSILSSFEKLNELLILINKYEIEWRSEITATFIDKCILINEDLFRNLNLSQNLRKETITDLTARKNKVVESIKSELKNKEVDKKEVEKK